MKPMFRLVSVFLLFAFVLGIAGPVSAEEEKDPVTITITMYADDALVENIYNITETVTEQYPYVTVEVQAIPWAEWYEKMLTQIAAGTSADVLYISSTHAPAFYAREALLDMGPYIADPDTGIDTDIFYPSIYSIGQYEGGVYLMSPDWTPLVAFINTDMFDAAGLPYFEDGWTLDNLTEACQELTLDENGNNALSPDFDPDSIVQWGADMGSPWNTWYDFLSNTWFAFETSTISPDGTQATGYMDSPEMLAAVEWYRDLVHKYHCAPTAAATEASGTVDMFNLGVTAIKFNYGPWNLETYQANPDLNFQVVSNPAGPDGHRANFTAWQGYGIWEGTENPFEAFQVVKAIAATESAGRILATRALSSIVSVNEELGRLDDPYWSPFLAEAEYALAPEGMRTDKFAVCIMEPFTAQVSDIIVSDVGGDFDPAPVLADLAVEADACLAGE